MGGTGGDWRVGRMKKAKYYFLSCITPSGVLARKKSNGCFSPVIPGWERQTLPLMSHPPLDRPHHVSKSSLMTLVSGPSTFCSFSTKTESGLLLSLTSGIPHCPMVWLLGSSIIASPIPPSKFLCLRDLGWVLFS